MKKSKKYLTLSLAGLLAFQSLSINTVRAIDYASNEDYYRNICSGIIRPSNEHYQECLGFKQYLLDKQHNLEQIKDDLQSQIDAVKANIQDLSNTINQYLNRMSELRTNIETMQTQIDDMNKNIEILKETIVKKEEDIEIKKQYIIARMRSTQYQNTINPYIDFIMGASNFIDMINRISIVSQLDKADKDKMDSLNKTSLH